MMPVINATRRGEEGGEVGVGGDKDGDGDGQVGIMKGSAIHAIM